MLQRVAAALGSGAAIVRSIRAVTPLASAARDRRRLAVRSSWRLSPQLSRITVPRPEQRKASSAARNPSTTSFACTTTIRSGESPASASPGA